MTHSIWGRLGLILIFALETNAVAQQPGQPVVEQDGGYSLHAKTKLVVLDVVVTDKKGNLVPNLKKDDFEIQEDKQTQRIASFESPEAHALPANVVIHSTEELDRLAPNAPTSIIVLDEFTGRYEDMGFARYSIKRYLGTQPKLLAQPAMLLAVNVNHIMMLHDYTQDKDAILSALDHHLAESPWTSGNKGIGEAWFLEQLNAGYRSLEQIAQSTAGHPGHKNVIWVGRGLPYISMTGKDAPGSDDVLKLKVILQKDINLLLASRVTLYTVDPAGIVYGIGKVPDGGLINMPFAGVVTFATVTQATGGRPFYGRNDVDALIGYSARDGEEFYTLSYVPSSASDEKGAFRNIRIVMKDPNLRATTRQGYFPNPVTEMPRQIASKKSDKPVARDVGAALATTLIYDGIPVTLTRGDAPGQAMVHVDSTSLPWVDHGPNSPRTTQVRIVSEMYEKNGKAMKHGAMSIVARAPAAKPDGPQQKVTVNLPLRYEADPRAVRLRVVVQALDSGKIGSANLDIAAK